MEAASAMSMDRAGWARSNPTAHEIPKLLHELMQSFNDENARIDEIAAGSLMDKVIQRQGTADGQPAALRRGRNHLHRTGGDPPRFQPSALVVVASASSAASRPPALTSSTSDPDLPGRHHCPHSGTADHLGGS